MEATNKPLPDSFTRKQREELFEEITLLYNLADNIAAAAELKGLVDPQAQVKLITPVITQVVNSANILSMFYTEVANKGRVITPDLRDTFEKAFCNIFNAVSDFTNEVEVKLLPQEEKLKGKSPANISYHSLKTILAAKFRQGVRPGALQNKMVMENSSLSPANGKFLVEAVNELGDHTAGLATTMGAIGLADFKKSVPEYGASTIVARKGGSLTLAEDGTIIVEPTRSTVVKINKN